RHALRAMQTTDLGPILHSQHPPSVAEGVKIHATPEGQSSRVADRSTPRGGLGLSGHQEDLLPGRGQDRMVGALLKAGMSEETALEQVGRLSAGDIWCG
ncbi:hypothetical protein, partial [Sinomonas gamaensis]|uniref:hypothetical protein n=1 Tax=Sinomonas gamaensis TaxID=2565624 RepID=UPI001BB27AE5